MRKKIYLSALIIVIFVNSLFAGWSHQTHSNYVKEAIRILPVFDYEMCVYYNKYLIEGAVEGEIHYRYISKGIYPSWLSKLNKNEIEFLNGIPITKQTVKEASIFFSKKFQSLQSNIDSLDKPYRLIFFELGYYLHSINNTLIPEYHGGKCPWQQLGSKTNEINIKTENISKINSLPEWLEGTLRENLAIRQKWTKMAESENKEEFLRIARAAHQRNIYNTASLIQFVINECFGPVHPKVRKKVEAIHEKKLNVNGERKPDF